MPELVLKLGDNVLQSYVFDKDMMSIGRSRDNDIVVENLSVSRNHARIRRQNGKYILTDLNSANGTYVNGVRVSKTEVVDNDIVTIGKHKLLFSDKPVDEDLVIGDAFGADRTVVVERSPVPMLCVTEGKLKGQEFQLAKFETSVGKAPSNDIVLGDDWFLGKKQAVLVRRGNAEYELHDMGGFRKSKINGEEVKEPRLLKPGDVIEFGNTRCVFQLSSDLPETGGRVPQEMSLEDSIFSSGISYPELAAGADREDHETPLIAEVEEDDQPAASAEEAFSGFDAAGLVREALGARSNEPPTRRPDSAEDPDEALFVRNPDTSEPEILLMPREDINGHVPAQSPTGDEAPDAAQPAAHVDENKDVAPEILEPISLEPEAPAEEMEPAMAVANSTPEQEDAAGSPSGGRMSRKKRRELQRQNKSGPKMQAAPAPESPAASEASFELPEELASTPVSSDEKPATQSPPASGDEIALWESALQNRSPVIRRQAAKMLKKLTGRDYEV